MDVMHLLPPNEFRYFIVVIVINLITNSIQIIIFIGNPIRNAFYISCAIGISQYQ